MLNVESIPGVLPSLEQASCHQRCAHVWRTAGAACIMCWIGIGTWLWKENPTMTIAGMGGMAHGSKGSRLVLLLEWWPACPRELALVCAAHLLDCKNRHHTTDLIIFGKESLCGHEHTIIASRVLLLGSTDSSFQHLGSCCSVILDGHHFW